MFINNLKHYIGRLWEIISKFELHAPTTKVMYDIVVTNNILCLLCIIKRIFCHINKIFYPCVWKILAYVEITFDLRGKYIL
jgi:hypothetical protein